METVVVPVISAPGETKYYKFEDRLGNTARSYIKKKKGRAYKNDI